jgi:hypothetical protein
MWLSYVALGSWTGSITASIYWMQLIIYVLFMLSAYLFTRRHLGVLTAFILLVMLSWFNYFGRTSTAAMSDFIFTLLMLVTTIAVWWFIQGGLSRVAMAGSAILIWVLCLASYATRSFAFPLAAAFAIGVLLVLAARLRVGSRARASDMSGLVLRTGVALLLATSASIVADVSWDRGARAHHSLYPKAKIVAVLPAASGSPAERRVDQIKREIAEADGVALSQQKFYLRRQFREEPGPVEEVWLQRLLAMPVLYVKALAGELLLNHHIVAKTLIPFFGETLQFVRYPDFPAYHYFTDQRETRVALFRSTGLIAEYGGSDLRLDIARAVGEVILAYGLIGLGAVNLFRHALLGGYVRAAALSLPVSLLMLAIGHSVEPRYLLPYYPLFITAEAVALAALGRKGLGWLCAVVLGSIGSSRQRKRHPGRLVRAL